jgi:hypothetical protein
MVVRGASLFASWAGEIAPDARHIHLLTGFHTYPQISISLASRTQGVSPVDPFPRAGQRAIIQMFGVLRSICRCSERQGPGVEGNRCCAPCGSRTGPIREETLGRSTRTSVTIREALHQKSALRGTALRVGLVEYSKTSLHIRILIS